MRNSKIDFKQLLFFFLFVFISFSGNCQSNNGILQVDNETFEVLKQVSESPLANGDILLSETTHQDLGWIDEIEKCVVMRDTMWLTPFMDRLKKEPGFEMDIEQSSILQEYIIRHPEKKREISAGLKEGRILVGATYIQPYEEMYFSESLARQFYLGKLWLKNTFDGYNSTTYYNSDVPGRSLQMPQLLARAGVENMFVSRQKMGVFDWYSPDGSKVTTYSPGHYIDFYNILAKENKEALKALAEQALFWTRGYNDEKGEKTVMPAVLNFEFIWDPKPVQNLYPFIEFWNNLHTVENEQGQQMDINLPKIKFSTLDKFFEQIRKSTKQLPSIAGERPNVWIYIHGPSHHWALDKSRKADILLPAAEKFSTASAITDGSFVKYPATLFHKAWESKIYPDHGWGGKGGQSTDDIFLMRFSDAYEKAKYLLDNSLQSLASKVKTVENKGIPIVVFNSLSWERTGPVVCQMNFEDKKARSVELYTKDGERIPLQYENIVNDKNGYLQSAEIKFVAQNVPSVGFETYYVKLSDQVPAKFTNSNDLIFENDFYKAKLSDGGISSIYDKELKKELIDNTIFNAGEIFTMKSEGNGAGEFDAVQQPSMEGFDKTGNYKTKWELTSDGPVFKTFKFRQPIRNAVAEVTVTFYNQIKKIDFNVSINNWDGTMFREYRMALPLNMKHGEIAYEVPFGVVTVGKDEIPGAAGERYNTLCNELHPRGIENWISASGNGFGVTLSSSVVGMDYIDPTGQSADATILQPILLASRRSCHGEGNDYNQTGNHSYSFSITSHKPGWEAGNQFGKEANEKLFAVVRPEKYVDASLNESESFLYVDSKDIIVSAIKKAENEDGVVIRLYNTSSRITSAELSLWKSFSEGYETNLIEEKQSKLSISKNKIYLDFGRNEIKTIKLK